MRLGLEILLTLLCQDMWILLINPFSVSETSHYNQISGPFLHGAPAHSPLEWCAHIHDIQIMSSRSQKSWLIKINEIQQDFLPGLVLTYLIWWSVEPRLQRLSQLCDSIAWQPWSAGGVFLVWNIASINQMHARHHQPQLPLITPRSGPLGAM